MERTESSLGSPWFWGFRDRSKAPSLFSGMRRRVTTKHASWLEDGQISGHMCRPVPVSLVPFRQELRITHSDKGCKGQTKVGDRRCSAHFRSCTTLPALELFMSECSVPRGFIRMAVALPWWLGAHFFILHYSSCSCFVHVGKLALQRRLASNITALAPEWHISCTKQLTSAAVEVWLILNSDKHIQARQRGRERERERDREGERERERAREREREREREGERERERETETSFSILALAPDPSHS